MKAPRSAAGSGVMQHSDANHAKPRLLNLLQSVTGIPILDSLQGSSASAGGAGLLSTYAISLVEWVLWMGLLYLGWKLVLEPFFYRYLLFPLWARSHRGSWWGNPNYYAVVEGQNASQPQSSASTPESRTIDDGGQPHANDGPTAEEPPALIPITAKDLLRASLVREANSNGSMSQMPNKRKIAQYRRNQGKGMHTTQLKATGRR
jgi:hypothetical protein